MFPGKPRKQRKDKGSRRSSRAESVGKALGSGFHKASSLGIRVGGAAMEATKNTRKQLSKGFKKGFNTSYKNAKS